MIFLRGIGHYVPEHKLTNSFFDSLDIGSDADFIESRVGIKERRSCLSPETIKLVKEGKISLKDLKAENKIPTMQDFARASWPVLKGRCREFLVDESQVELCVVGTSTPDDDIPAHGCSLGNAVNFTKAVGFDVNSACSTFVVELQLISSLLNSNNYKNAAFFCMDRYTTRVDYNNKKTCILFGDSAACGYLEKSDIPGGLRLIDTWLESDGSGYSLIRMPTGEFFDQSGQAVQKFAVQKTIYSVQKILERNNLAQNQISYFISHQANLRMLEYCAEKLKLRPDQHLFNVDLFGNQGSAGAPVVMSMNWDKFKPGDYVVVAVVGSGLTWGAALFQMT